MASTVIRPDSTTGIDTYVDVGSPNTAHANETAINYCGNSLNHIHGLLRFDLTSLPAASASGAFLVVTFTDTSTPYPANVHRILPANAGWLEACTWNYRDGAGASQRWAGDVGNDGGADAGCGVPGTDYAAAVMGSFTTGTDTGSSKKYYIELDLAEFAAMRENNAGFLIHANSSTSTTQIIPSCEYGVAADRPYLIVQFDGAERWVHEAFAYAEGTGAARASAVFAYAEGAGPVRASQVFAYLEAHLVVNAAFPTVHSHANGVVGSNIVRPL